VNVDAQLLDEIVRRVLSVAQPERITDSDIDLLGSEAGAR
jgi:hypothetical protein